MAKPKVTKAEVKFAQAFIRAARGNSANGYLLLAVIAWMRAESGQRYIGNNPFNLRPGSDIAEFMSGKRKGPVGYFAVFPNLSAAAKATVARLLRVGAWAGYRPIIAALRDRPKKSKYADQAYLFLLNVAKSKWSSTHYGYRPYVPEHTYRRQLPNGTWETITVPAKPAKPPRLFKIFEGLTGGPAIPASWFQDTTTTTHTTTKKAPPPPPRQPRSLVHVNPPPDYLQPYATRDFYHARPHSGDFVLPQEDDDIDW